MNPAAWVVCLCLMAVWSVALITAEQQVSHFQEGPGITASVPAPAGNTAPDRFGGSSSYGPATSHTEQVKEIDEMTEEERYPGITERRNFGLKIVLVLLILAVLSDAWNVIRTPHFSADCMEVYPDPEIGWWKYWIICWLLIIIVAPADYDISFD